MQIRQKILNLRWVVTYLFYECYQQYYVKERIPGIYQWEDPADTRSLIYKITIVRIGRFTDSYRVIYSKHSKVENCIAAGELIGKWIGFYQPRNRELVNDTREKVFMFVHELQLMCNNNREFTKISTPE